MQGDARDLVREGTVTACFPERHTCRVEFADKDGLISAELPVLTLWGYKNKCYALPDVGDMVVVLNASNADQTGTGWIIGCRFNDKIKPNASSQDITRVDFSDKTSVEYDRSKKKLTIDAAGEIAITAAKNISIKTTKGNITISSAGTLTLSAKKAINVTGDAAINVQAKADITAASEANTIIKGETVQLNPPEED